MANPWLQLLLSGGSPDDVARLRDQLPESADDAAAALQVLAQLGERRQRAAELAAVYELAVRLTAVRERDALLQEIVTQGRRLLDVDVAYLALREGEGDEDAIVIKVADGTVGPHLKGVRLSLAGGLAGQVMMTGEPFWTSDYLNEPGITHIESADKVATGEQLTSILGVPLRRGAEAVGVLFASMREHRPFAPSEVSLLSSLAAHAVVAIDNAALFEQLAASNAQLRQTAEAVERAAAHHDRLMEIALHGGDIDDVVASLADLIDGPVRFIEVDGDAPAPQEGVHHVPVRGGAHLLGVLELRSDAPPHELDLRLLERSAMTIALIVSAERAATESEWRTTDEVLATLLQDREVDPDVLHRRARSVGLDLQHPHVVVVATPPSEALTATLGAARHVIAATGGLLGRHRGSIVLLLPVDLAEAVKRCGELRPQVTCGVAGPATGQTSLIAAYEDARRCVRVLEALGRSGETTTPGALGPYRYLLSEAGRADAAVFVEAQIGALLAHDRDRGTDLTHTLATFLASGRQHAQSARDLAIHSNTLYQRLDRIAQVVGEDWRTPERSFDLQLALQLHKLAQSTRLDEV
ncbi:MAG TPA: GAF domain-containing protein [Mycobacteriales bacterium]|nr:GAF domain-containing protein [Mycobacteriales bacterium]